MVQASLEPATPFVAPSKLISFAFLRRVAPEKGLLGSALRLILGGFVFGRFVLAATLLFTLPTIALALLAAAAGLADFETAGPVVALGLGALFLIAELAHALDPRRVMTRRALRGRGGRAWRAFAQSLPLALAAPPEGRLRTARQRVAAREHLYQAAALALLFAAFAAASLSPLAERVVMIDGEPVQLAQLLVGGVVVAAFAIVFAWRRLRAAPAARILAEDDRAPILLLRPFETDGRTLPRVTGGRPWFTDAAATALFDHFTTLENALAEVADRFGPFVGIGIPGELLRTDGAARDYVDHDAWRDYALAKMAESRAIICVWGVSPSFGWEIEQIFSRGYLEKTVFVFPPARSNAFQAAEGAELPAAKRRFLERLGVAPDDDAAADDAVLAAAAPGLVLSARRKYDSAYMAGLLVALLAQQAAGEAETAD
ncbi:MAG: hypothetical protein AAFR16_09550 [Pseudomonadota bacterium]